MGVDMHDYCWRVSCQRTPCREHQTRGHEMRPAAPVGCCFPDLGRGDAHVLGFVRRIWEIGCDALLEECAVGLGDAHKALGEEGTGAFGGAGEQESD